MNRNILVTALMFTTMLVGASAQAANAPDNRDVVRSMDGSIIVNTFNNCVRTKWEAADDVCAPDKPEAQRTRRVLAQEERTVYFGFNLATLTQQAKDRLDSLANTLKSEQDVKEARIVGFADRIGSTSYNEKLSKKRAEAVRKYIISRGYANARVAETRWLGETTPVTSCPDTMSRAELIECLQKDRRVEVEIDYLPETKAIPRR